MCIVFTGSRDGRKSSEKTVSRYARLVAQLGRKHIDCRRRATTVAVYLGIYFFSFSGRAEREVGAKERTGKTFSCRAGPTTI